MAMKFDRFPHDAPQAAIVRDIRDVHDAIVSCVETYDRDMVAARSQTHRSDIGLQAALRHVHRHARDELQRLELELARQSQFTTRERSRALRLIPPAPLAIHSEIRAYLRSLSAQARDTLLSDALASGDRPTLDAALFAPAYLSGLTPDKQGELRTRLSESQDAARLAELAEAERIAERTRAALDAARVHIERAREPAQEAA